MKTTFYLFSLCFVCLFFYQCSNSYLKNPSSNKFYPVSKIIETDNEGESEAEDGIKEAQEMEFKLTRDVRFGDVDGKIYHSTTIHLQNIDEKGSSWEAYPNPFTANLNIRLANELEGEIQVQMVDVIGRIVYRQAQSMNSVEKIISLNNLESLPSGLYFIKITNSDNLVLYQANVAK